MSSSGKLLCVFSEEQEAEIRPGLEALRPAGLEVLWRRDGEAALAELPSLRPDLVVVGMDLGPMEGLEFLALALKADPTSTCPVMLAPGTGDPFPPVVHRRDPATGRSLADELDRGDLPRRIVDLAASVLQGRAPAEAAAPAPTVAAPAAVAAPVSPQVVAPAQAGAPPLTAPPVEVAPLLTAQPPPRSRSRGLLLVVLLGVLGLAAAAGAYALWPTGSRTGAAGSGEPSRPAPDARAKPTPAAVRVDAGARAPDRAVATGTPAPSTRLPDKVVLPISFARASATATIDDDARLAEIVAAIKADPRLRLEVGGHTSNEGAEPFNQRLGLSRAQAAIKLLTSKGVPGAQLRAKSHGGTRPIAENATEEGRARNRRVTLRRR